MIAYLSVAIAALIMNGADITTVYAIPKALPSCSWIDDSQPGGDFNRMYVSKYEMDQSGCVISWTGEGTTFVPCMTYNVTVTSPEAYGQALSAVGASIIANAGFESYEIQPGCRGQQRQQVSHFSFVAPKSGTVKISALCGQPNIMYTAAKAVITAQKGNGVCAKPTKKPTAFPTKKPTKPTRSPTSFPTKPTTSAPTTSPTAPTTAAPTVKPTTAAPTKRPTPPTRSPTIKPTRRPASGR